MTMDVKVNSNNLRNCTSENKEKRKNNTQIVTNRKGYVRISIEKHEDVKAMFAGRVIES